MDTVMSMKTIDRLNVLRSVSVFAGTPDELLVAISAVLEELRFPAGAPIFSKGDLGDCLYIVAEGLVRAHDGERTLNTLGAGDIFGEMSALDPEAEAGVFQELRDHLKGRIGIVISHRFSTVRIADRIAVLEGGRVTEHGTHNELIEHNGRYATLFNLQAAGYH